MTYYEGQEIFIDVNPVQRLLIRTIISERQETLKNLSEWLKNVDLENLDDGSYRLLPMIYRKIVQIKSPGVNEDIKNKIKKVYNFYYSSNEQIINNAYGALKIIHEAGIDIMLIKGISMVLGVGNFKWKNR